MTGTVGSESSVCKHNSHDKDVEEGERDCWRACSFGNPGKNFCDGGGQQARLASDR